jgi:hypothetical protein
MSEQNNQAGKGDNPRNCFSQKYRDNFDSINWNKKQKKENEKIIDSTDAISDK